MPAHHFALTVTACLILFIFRAGNHRERALKSLLLCRPAFVRVATQWHRRPETAVDLHYALGHLEAGFCSGGRVRRPTVELPPTVRPGLALVAPAARGACCSPAPEGPKAAGSQQSAGVCPHRGEGQRVCGCRRCCPPSPSSSTHSWQAGWFMRCSSVAPMRIICPQLLILPLSPGKTERLMQACYSGQTCGTGCFYSPVPCRVGAHCGSFGRPGKWQWFLSLTGLDPSPRDTHTSCTAEPRMATTSRWRAHLASRWR